MKLENSGGNIPQQEKKDKILNRGSFLSLSFLVTAAMVGKPLVQYAKVFNGLIKAEVGEENNSIFKTIKYIEETYGLELYNGKDKIRDFTNPDNVRGEKANLEEIKKWLTILISELIKYPPEFFKNNNIDNVRLIDSLSVSTEEGGVEGYASGNTIALDYVQAHSDETNRASLHHEVFHVVENSPRYFIKRKEWKKIHTHDVFGEDNSSSEEMARIAHRLMMPKEHRNFGRMAIDKNDPKILSEFEAKYEWIKSIYKTASDGKMDEEYWQNLLDDKIEANYFS